MPIAIAVAIVATNIGLAAYFWTSSPSSLEYWFPFPFFPLLFIPVVFLIFFGFRWFFWGCWWGRDSYFGGYYYEDPAMVTLRERYVKGEITREQLESMTRDLENHVTS